MNSNPGATALYVWKLGQTSWTQIGPAFPTGIGAITESSVAGQHILSIVEGDGSVATLKLPAGQ